MKIIGKAYGEIRMTTELERQKEKIHRIEPKTTYKESVTMDQDSSELFEHRLFRQ